MSPWPNARPPAEIDAGREAAAAISARIVLEHGLLLDRFTFIPHD
jgi:hypothetical protein